MSNLEWAVLQAELAVDLIELRDNLPELECEIHEIKMVWDASLLMYMCLDCESERYDV